MCLFGIWQKLRHATKPTSIGVAGCCVEVYEKLKTLGITQNNKFTFEAHTNGVVRLCNFHICALRHIRRHLTRDVANMVACSIVSTRMNYCNSLLYDAADKHLEKLQRAQNKLARTILNVGIRDHHTSDLLRKLHWLPIRSRIVFKVTTLCRRALSDGEPTYLASIVNYYRPTRTLRSADQSPRRTTITNQDCSTPFLVFGPKNLELFTANNTQGGHTNGI